MSAPKIFATEFRRPGGHENITTKAYRSASVRRIETNSQSIYLSIKINKRLLIYTFWLTVVTLWCDDGKYVFPLKILKMLRILFYSTMADYFYIIIH